MRAVQREPLSVCDQMECYKLSDECVCVVARFVGRHEGVGETRGELLLHLRVIRHPRGGTGSAVSLTLTLPMSVGLESST